MWLLHTPTVTLHRFYDQPPPYAILSHTWGAEEVSFDDMNDPDHCAVMGGYRKITKCCEQAKEDGFIWAWVDTCCIDKRSSAELSEAINSMYEYYWNASICYAYLQDVSDEPPSQLNMEPKSHAVSEFARSALFARGWTLQELLAPDHVESYTRSWNLIGTKLGLVSKIEQATQIDRGFLENRWRIKSASIATKFSWASQRKTTRAEDLAYCLLGLVSIDLPMLYGEGDRAFYRLQLELLRKSNEHTIFAWAHSSTSEAEDQSSAVLADSPARFKGSAGIRPIQDPRSEEAFTHEDTNNGLRIVLPSVRTGQDQYVAFIHCQNESGENVGIKLERLANQQYRRAPGKALVDLRDYEHHAGGVRSMYLALDADRDTHAPPSIAMCQVGRFRRVNDYRVTGVSLSSPGEVIRVQTDGFDFNMSNFTIPGDSLACVHMTSPSCQPRNVVTVFGAYENCPVMYHMRNERPAAVTLKVNWVDELKTRPRPPSTGIDCIRVKHRAFGEEYVWFVTAEVIVKKRMQKGELIWSFSLQISRCKCEDEE